jgi:RNA polymerase sigma factor (sigma-70 family)
MHRAEMLARARNEHETGTDTRREMEAMYERCAPSALRLAYVLSGDRETAQDLVHDAFLRVFSRPSRRELRVFEAYLNRAIVNGWRSLLRRKRYERAFLKKQATQHDAYANGDTDAAHALWQAVRSLPTRQRIAVFLRYYEGRSYDEISEVLEGCSLGAVRSLLNRGLRRLKEDMKDD